MIKQLKKVHLQTYEFFDAIRPSTLDLEAWNPYFLNPIPYWFKLTGGNELKYKNRLLRLSAKSYGSDKTFYRTKL